MTHFCKYQNAQKTPEKRKMYVKEMIFERKQFSNKPISITPAHDELSKTRHSPPNSDFSSKNMYLPMNPE